MAASTGSALKVLQWFNRGVEFCCAGLILALNTYFIATMAAHKITIPVSLRATEGISGSGVLYTGLGLLLLCCLAGFTLTSFIAIVLDISFLAAFIYTATVFRHGTSSCKSGSLDTVYGTGDAASKVTSPRGGSLALPTYRVACRMETACLAAAIVAVVLFFISALTELAIGRHHKKEKRFGPSPANDYTSGYGPKRRGLFGFRHKRDPEAEEVDNPNALPTHTTPDEVRGSYNTDATGADDPAANTYYFKYSEAGYGEPGYNEHAAAAAAATATGHNTPQSLAANKSHNYRYGDGTYNL